MSVGGGRSASRRRRDGRAQSRAARHVSAGWRGNRRPSKQRRGRRCLRPLGLFERCLLSRELSSLGLEFRYLLELVEHLMDEAIKGISGNQGVAISVAISFWELLVDLRDLLGVA